MFPGPYSCAHSPEDELDEGVGGVETVEEGEAGGEAGEEAGEEAGGEAGGAGPS